LIKNHEPSAANDDDELPTCHCLHFLSLEKKKKRIFIFLEKKKKETKLKTRR
jgi:hypothetical protein